MEELGMIQALLDPQTQPWWRADVQAAAGTDFHECLVTEFLEEDGKPSHLRCPARTRASSSWRSGWASGTATPTRRRSSTPAPALLWWRSWAAAASGARLRRPARVGRRRRYPQGRLGALHGRLPPIKPVRAAAQGPGALPRVPLGPQEPPIRPPRPDMFRVLEINYYRLSVATGQHDRHLRPAGRVVLAGPARPARGGPQADILNSIEITLLC